MNPTSWKNLPDRYRTGLPPWFFHWLAGFFAVLYLASSIFCAFAGQMSSAFLINSPILIVALSMTHLGRAKQQLASRSYRRDQAYAPTCQH